MKNNLKTVLLGLAMLLFVSSAYAGPDVVPRKDQTTLSAEKYVSGDVLHIEARKIGKEVTGTVAQARTKTIEVGWGNTITVPLDVPEEANYTPIIKVSIIGLITLLIVALMFPPTTELNTKFNTGNDPIRIIPFNKLE